MSKDEGKGQLGWDEIGDNECPQQFKKAGVDDGDVAVI